MRALAPPMLSGSPHHILFLVALLPLSATASGCSGIPMTDDATGTTHHLILGFGVVSTPAPASGKDVSVVRIHTLGLAADTGPAGGLMLGYKSATAVVADKDADAVAEIAPGIFGPMTVTTSNSDKHENP